MKDRTGETFGRLTVIGRSSSRGDPVIWKCQCLCGNITIVRAQCLVSGATRSCGCFRKEKHLTHGMSKTPEYRIWADMIKRCGNPNHIAYKNYGERSIGVSREWRSFENFYADMGKRPSRVHSLERKDNNGNYEKGNVIWADPHTQSRNTRRTIRITLRGKTQCLKDWANELGLHYKRVQARILSGWSVEKAFSEPPISRRPTGL